jgi:8-oxoguanine deaminase
MSTLLVNNADLLITMDAQRRCIPGEGLSVRENAIEQAGPSAELPESADAG